VDKGAKVKKRIFNRKGEKVEEVRRKQGKIPYSIPFLTSSTSRFFLCNVFLVFTRY
jgi:hypothetical protein